MTAFIWNNLSVNRMAHTVRKPKIHFSVPKGLGKLVSKSSEFNCTLKEFPRDLQKLLNFFWEDLQTFCPWMHNFLRKQGKNHAKKFFWRTILYWKHSRLSFGFWPCCLGCLSLSFLAMVPLFVVLSRSIFYGMRGTERRRVLCCCCFRTVVWSFSPFFLCAVLLRHASGASHLLKNTNQILPTLVLLQGLLFFSFCKPALCKGLQRLILMCFLKIILLQRKSSPLWRWDVDTGPLYLYNWMKVPSSLLYRYVTIEEVGFLTPKRSPKSVFCVVVSSSSSVLDMSSAELYLLIWLYY